MKYELTDEIKTTCSGHKVRRIRALRAVGTHVATGDLGGWVESELNLSQDGDSWVYDDAVVLGRARVSDNAHVHGLAHVYGNAHVSGNAHVYHSAHVYGNAHVYDRAWVAGNATVVDADVCNTARILDAVVTSNASYLVFKYPDGGDFTYTKSNQKWSAVDVFRSLRSCSFSGTGAELVCKAHAENPRLMRFCTAIVMAVKAIEAVERGCMK